jgi:hypothetical protein
MGAWNRVDIGLSYRPARLHRLADQFFEIDSWAPKSLKIPALCWFLRHETIDQITLKTPNPKCRLYWCLTEFTDWTYIQSF